MQLVNRNRWLPILAAVLFLAIVIVMADSVRTSPYAHYLERVEKTVDHDALERQIASAPENDNAAALLLQAISLLDESSPEENNVLIERDSGMINRIAPGEPVPEALRQVLTDYVSRWAGVIPLIHEGARRTGFHVDVSFEFGNYRDIMAASARNKRFRWLSGVLRFEGLDAIARGDEGRLETCLESALRLPLLLSLEPRHFYAIAEFFASDAFFLLEHALSRNILSRNALERYQLLLEAPFYASLSVIRRAYAYALADRREWQLAKGFLCDDGDLDFYFATMWLLFHAGTMETQERLFYDFLLADAICLQEPEDIGKAFKEVSALVNAYSQDRLDLRSSDNLFNVYGQARLDYWSYSMLFDAALSQFEIFAQAATARMAVAAARFRLDHQRLPDTPEELIPDYLDEIPRDPLQQALPLGYHHEPDCVIVESKGYAILDPLTEAKIVDKSIRFTIMK